MKKTLLALALTASLGAASSSHAGAYAIAYDDITNLFITNTPGITFSPPASVNSASVACLPNGTCVTGGGAGFVNAPPSQIGLPGYMPDSYATHELNLSSFALADASIDKQQLVGDPFTRARNMAEGKLLETNTANATAGNSSATVLRSVFTVGGPSQTINFQFDADPFIRAALSGNHTPPSQAEGIIGLNFSIINSTGTVVFNWAPDGAPGGIIGGTESADAFTLNTSLTALPGNPGPLTYDPLSCPVGSLGTGCFNATTFGLTSGIYTLNLSMRETVNLQLTTQTVPEPDTIFMLGIGLAALAAFGRRKIANDRQS